MYVTHLRDTFNSGKIYFFASDLYPHKFWEILGIPSKRYLRVLFLSEAVISRSLKVHSVNKL